MAPSSKIEPKEKVNKRRRYPSYVKIEKRPLLRPPIPSPYLSAKDPKIIYLKRSTPFIPTIKRIRSLLAKAEKRALQSASLKPSGELEPRDTLRLAHVKVNEFVYLKATGRAIYRALEIAWFFQQQQGSGGQFTVRVKTGSVGAVDDVIEGPPSTSSEDRVESRQGVEDSGEIFSSQEDGEDIPESQLRQTSMIEVTIGPK